MFYCLCFIPSTVSRARSPPLFTPSTRCGHIRRCFTIPRRRWHTTDTGAEAATCVVHVFIQRHPGAIWHCHHLVIKPLLALNMKSWQELLLMMMMMTMTLAVTQPRFSTSYPDTRAGSILSRRCPCLAIHFCPANTSVSVITEIWECANLCLWCSVGNGGVTG